MNDKLPIEMVQSFSADNGKRAVFIIESEKSFPTPPFKGEVQRAQRGNVMLFSKMFSGTLKVAADYLQLDNSAAIHKPKYDIGEIELDFILTLTSRNGQWFLNYFDKSTNIAIDLPFHGFMYSS